MRRQSLAARTNRARQRLPGRVDLRLEWVSDQDASRLLQAADAVVLPYRHITTSGSAMLALGHGRPLVVPDLPGLAELPDDAVVRYDGTTQGLGRALAGIILADAAVLAKMSAAAFEYGAAVNWSEIAEQTLAELSDLASNFLNAKTDKLRIDPRR